MKLNSIVAAVLVAVGGAANAVTPMTPGVTPNTWSFAQFSGADESFSFTLPSASSIFGSVLGFGFSFGPAPSTFKIDGVTLSGSPVIGSGTIFTKVNDFNYSFAGNLGAGTWYVNVDTSGGPGVYGGNMTAPVPEPETYALLLAGLGVVGFVARRRRPE